VCVADGSDYANALAGIGGSADPERPGWHRALLPERVHLLDDDYLMPHAYPGVWDHTAAWHASRDWMATLAAPVPGGRPGSWVRARRVDAMVRWWASLEELTAAVSVVLSDDMREWMASRGDDLPAGHMPPSALYTALAARSDIDTFRSVAGPS
jgi:hypothetical protein